jgi:hypothetical protein
VTIGIPWLLAIVSKQAADLGRPPVKFVDLIDRLARVVPTFARMVRDEEGTKGRDARRDRDRGR